jgi:serine protease Do
MKLIRTLVVSFLAGIAGAWVFQKFQTLKEQDGILTSNMGQEFVYQPNIVSRVPVADDSKSDFTAAAARTIPSVVYINSITQSGVSSYSIYDMLFGNSGKQTQVSSGSGVIFSSDGYIVTNNHVVETAERIEVLYNKKVYQAELVGTDPSTDLAVLKIKETGLPAIALGSSAHLGVGEWVVAVGNPFSLTSTVTVGIVSAKGRSINVVSDKFPIESFIQTDAAINPGNSGGALVNKNGELVGINTAILSRTGSYTGYAFAVPVDIVKKVVNDLIRYGVIQKALIGGEVVEYDFKSAQKFGLKTEVKEFRGVLLAELANGGAAQLAGLKAGDVITKINQVEINSRSAFEEELSYRSPGDKVSLTYLRNDEMQSVDITLLNRNGETSTLKRKIYSNGTVGANLEAVEYGVKIFKIKDGLFKKLGIPENYTIITINRQRVKDPQEVIDFFEKYRGRVLLYGINSSKQEYPLQFFLQ